MPRKIGNPQTYSFVSLEKERRARLIVENKGANPRRNPVKDPKPSMEEKAYAKAVAENPDIEGEELVKAVYEKLNGVILYGQAAENQNKINRRLKEANEALM